jgi:copper chaperone NosL
MRKGTGTVLGTPAFTKAPAGSPKLKERRRRGSVLGLALLAACAAGPPQPVALDTKNTECANCRMIVSDVHYAAQIVAPGEEPRFFDDVGCLRSYLKGGAALPSGAVAYVADHRTGEWVTAADAVYTKIVGYSTPMNSGLIAHADVASRDADPGAQRGERVGGADVFGAGGPPR